MLRFSTAVIRETNGTFRFESFRNFSVQVSYSSSNSRLESYTMSSEIEEAGQLNEA